MQQGNLLAVLQNRWRSHRGRVRRLLPVAVQVDRGRSRRVNGLLSGGSDHDCSYLEIGLYDGRTFETVVARHRTGVDPAPRFDLERIPDGARVFVGTSDDFFEQLPADVKFDVSFVDGLHEFEQTYRDIICSFQHLKRGGFVLVDDVVPADEVAALRSEVESYRLRAERGLAGTPWNGDVFKVLEILRTQHPELEFRVVVGTGNEQAVVWNTRPDAPEVLPAGALEALDLSPYSEVFRDGVPDWFRPGTEDEVIAEALRSTIELWGEPM